MGEELRFRVSSALKDIIGRDLITDDYIAVFELVKNSYDAHAKEVKIIFKQDSLIIIDDGKGMNYDDLINKWLFVAYSAKHEGVEDDELELSSFINFRDKIQKQQVFAGSKGIGRFSCDRLGKELVLTTRKITAGSKIERLQINWQDFEQNPKNDFINVNVIHSNPSNIDFSDKQYGTVLEIKGLRSSWPRRKKQELKHSLEKLINPFSSNEKNRIEENFSIIIEDPEEHEADKKEKLDRNKVNGLVKNILFEKLKLKTTQILMEVEPYGEYVHTSLIDRDIPIYNIKEKNDSSPQLKNIRYQLFYLNRSAKLNFNKIMGMNVKDYGSVFLYKNGFRVYPFGEPGEDVLGIDKRKAQGYKRFLGTREIIGRIEISDDSDFFRETSSRDGGLIENAHYDELTKMFYTCLKRLENYVVDLQWQLEKDHYNEVLKLEDTTISEKIISIIAKLTNSTSLVDFEYNTQLFQIIKNKLSEATPEVFIDLANIASKSKNEYFIQEVNSAQKMFSKFLNEKIEAERKAIEEQELRIKAEREKRQREEELEIERQKNTFLLASERGVSNDARGLIHHIKLVSTKINAQIETLYQKIFTDSLPKKDLLKRLTKIKLNSDKVLKISKLITRANFNRESAVQAVDIVKYIQQYIEIYSDIYKDLDIEFIINGNDCSLFKRISVLELSIVIDNLVSNSEKAGAKKIQLDFIQNTPKNLLIKFSDNGIGLNKKYNNNAEAIFDIGVTTTDGSGIGLYTARDILKRMNGNIKFAGNGIVLSGASFNITIQ